MKPAELRFRQLQRYADPVTVMGQPYERFASFPAAESGRLNRLFRLAMSGKDEDDRDNLLVGQIVVSRTHGKKQQEQTIAFEGRADLVAKLGQLNKPDLERATVRHEIDEALRLKQAGLVTA